MPAFWNKQTAVEETLQELNDYEYNLLQYNQWRSLFEDTKAALELLELQTDAELLCEAQTNISQLSRELDQFEIQQLLTGTYDRNGAFLTITAQSDGTDAQDWVGLLLQIYAKWGESKNYQVRLVECCEGDWIGFKFATAEIAGRYAYGYLKSEQGKHRLKRISPFNADGKCQTSTSGVEVIPIVDLDIPQKDLEIITSRSGIKSGQNANGVQTWVRIVHIPTGISVTCRAERSQIQNRDKALSILKSKLWAIAHSLGVQEIAQIQPDKIKALSSNLIRDYIFHPHQLVKDLRTGLQTSAVTEVLNGNIDFLIGAYLRQENQLVI